MKNIKIIIVVIVNSEIIIKKKKKIAGTQIRKSRVVRISSPIPLSSTTM